MIIPTLEDRTCVTPLYYSLPAAKLAEGMSTEDGQDVLKAETTDDGWVYVSVYTPRTDDPAQDEENRRGPETRVYEPGERVGLAVFRDTARHGLADPDAVISPPTPDADEPIHAWADADGVWYARVTMRPEYRPDDLPADAERVRLRALDAICCEIGHEPSPVREVEQAGTDQDGGHVVAVTYRGVTHRELTARCRPSSPSTPTARRTSAG